MKKIQYAILVAFVAASLGSKATAAEKGVSDAGIPAYSAKAGISGSISSIGSDTLNNLMTFWAEGFKKQYPNVKIEIEGKGSSTAPPALIAGTAQLGPMSREMKPSEIDAFEKKHGYKPTQIRVSLDALSVFVNKNSSVDKLKMEEVDAIFSKSRRGGMKAIDNWKAVGGSAGKISLYGRNSASGTYGFFKDNALFGGDFRPDVKEQPGSASVVQGVARDKDGIGYSGMGYKTSGVKAIAIAAKGSSDYIEPNAENVYAKKYPLRRYLYVYINKNPSKGADPLVSEFIKYIVSKNGQDETIKDGFLPLPAETAKEENKKVD